MAKIDNVVSSMVAGDLTPPRRQEAVAPVATDLPAKTVRAIVERLVNTEKYGKSWARIERELGVTNAAVAECYLAVQARRKALGIAGGADDTAMVDAAERAVGKAGR